VKSDRGIRNRPIAIRNYHSNLVILVGDLFDSEESRRIPYDSGTFDIGSDGLVVVYNNIQYRVIRMVLEPVSSVTQTTLLAPRIDWFRQIINIWKKIGEDLSEDIQSLIRRRNPQPQRFPIENVTVELALERPTSRGEPQDQDLETLEEFGLPPEIYDGPSLPRIPGSQKELGLVKVIRFWGNSWTYLPGIKLIVL
jgi:hypothetical protein